MASEELDHGTFECILDIVHGWFTTRVSSECTRVTQGGLDLELQGSGVWREPVSLEGAATGILQTATNSTSELTLDLPDSDHWFIRRKSNFGFIILPSIQVKTRSGMVVEATYSPTKQCVAFTLLSGTKPEPVDCAIILLLLIRWVARASVSGEFYS
jgi:hypothetical protein